MEIERKIEWKTNTINVHYDNICFSSYVYLLDFRGMLFFTLELAAETLSKYMRCTPHIFWLQAISIWRLYKFAWGCIPYYDMGIFRSVSYKAHTWIYMYLIGTHYDTFIFAKYSHPSAMEVHMRLEIAFVSLQAEHGKLEAELFRTTSRDDWHVAYQLNRAFQCGWYIWLGG